MYIYDGFNFQNLLYSMFLGTQNDIFSQVWSSANSIGNGVGSHLAQGINSGLFSTVDLLIVLAKLAAVSTCNCSTPNCINSNLLDTKLYQLVTA